MSLGRVATLVVVLAGLFDAAHAGERIVRGNLGVVDADLPRHSCYRVEYVPALYLVNTRGKLVQPERYVWRGDIVDGARVHHERIPAVYLQTRVLLEPDHYTLVRVPCQG